MSKKKFTFITIAIMAFIFFQSALPADLSSAESGVIVEWILRTFRDVFHLSREMTVFAVRKGAHFTEYAVLGGFLVPAVQEWVPTGRDHREVMKTHARRDSFLPAWVIGVLYSATDEMHQFFVPGRSCELRDVVLDSCGVLTGAAIVWLVRRYSSNRPSRTQAL